MKYAAIMSLFMMSGCMRPRLPSPGVHPPMDAPSSTGYSIAQPTGGDLSPLLAFASWVGVAACLVLVVLAIVIPGKSNKQLIGTFALAAIALVVAANIFGHVLAWLPWISLILAIVGVCYGLYWLSTRLLAAVRSTNIAVGTLKEISPVEWERVKARMISSQGRCQKDLDELAHGKEGLNK